MKFVPVLPTAHEADPPRVRLDQQQGQQQQPTPPTLIPPPPEVNEEPVKVGMKRKRDKADGDDGYYGLMRRCANSRMVWHHRHGGLLFLLRVVAGSEDRPCVQVPA
ncbi:hypothetical protein LTR85_007639 [Meristemomyces frigidus]|nr:hypothetical protein LTR85_007639 [Meristemomyces frigidus]